MNKTIQRTILGLVIAGFATPVHAGLKQDLRRCTSANGLKSASACTRVVRSGRLPRRQHYIAYFNRGWGYRVAEKFTKARADFDRAIRMNPKFADTYYARSVIHYDLGQPDKSLADLDRYIELKGSKWKAFFKRALMLRRLGEHGRALADLKRAANREPDSTKVAALRALVLSDAGNHILAQSEISRTIDDDPKEASAYYARAIINFRQNRLKEAKADAEKAISLRKNYPAAHAILGRILEASGDAAGARASYKTAVESPMKNIEEMYARTEARERHMALAQAASQPVKTAAAKPANTEPTPSEKPIKSKSAQEPPKTVTAEAEADTKPDKPATKTATEETPPKPVKTSQVALDCRRFVPTAGVTIAIACTD